MRATRLNLQAFVDEFLEADKLMQDKPYCWILGAGTSVSSGIPAGGYFAGRWFDQIHRREKNDSESTADFAKRLPALAKEHHIDLDGFDPARPALHYSALYDYRFRDDVARGFAQLEEAMRGKGEPPDTWPPSTASLKTKKLIDTPANTLVRVMLMLAAPDAAWPLTLATMLAEPLYES